MFHILFKQFKVMMMGYLVSWLSVVFKFSNWCLWYVIVYLRNIVIRLCFRSTNFSNIIQSYSPVIGFWKIKKSCIYMNLIVSKFYPPLTWTTCRQIWLTVMYCHTWVTGLIYWMVRYFREKLKSHGVSQKGTRVDAIIQIWLPTHPPQTTFKTSLFQTLLCTQTLQSVQKLQSVQTLWTKWYFCPESPDTLFCQLTNCLFTYFQLPITNCLLPIAN